MEEGEEMEMEETMTADEANAVYDILQREAGAPESMREDFIFHQTQEVCVEYRFQGSLGFGGKFWRNVSGWYVDCYPEDNNDYRKHVQHQTNEALKKLNPIEVQPIRLGLASKPKPEGRQTCVRQLGCCYPLECVQEGRCLWC